MKLAANLLLTVFWPALAEAFSVVRSGHIEPARLINLLTDPNIGAGILRACGARVAAALAGQDTGAATFDIDFMRKDMRDMEREAQALGISLPVLFSCARWRQSTQHRQPATAGSTAPGIPPTGSITPVRQRGFGPIALTATEGPDVPPLVGMRPERQTTLARPMHLRAVVFQGRRGPNGVASRSIVLVVIAVAFPAKPSS